MLSLRFRAAVSACPLSTSTFTRNPFSFSRLRIPHFQVDAASFLKQLHLRSCGLVVLSRGGFVDDMQSVEDAETMISAGQEVTKRKDGEDVADGDKDDTPVGYLAMYIVVVMVMLWSLLLMTIVNNAAAVTFLYGPLTLHVVAFYITPRRCSLVSKDQHESGDVDVLLLEPFMMHSVSLDARMKRFVLG